MVTLLMPEAPWFWERAARLTVPPVVTRNSEPPGEELPDVPTTVRFWPLVMRVPVAMLSAGVAVDVLVELTLAAVFSVTVFALAVFASRRIQNEVVLEPPMVVFVEPAKVIVEVPAVKVPLLVQLPLIVSVWVPPVRTAPDPIVSDRQFPATFNVGMVAAAPEMVASVVAVGTPELQLAASLQLLLVPPFHVVWASAAGANTQSSNNVPIIRAIMVRFLLLARFFARYFLALGHGRDARVNSSGR